MVIRLLKHVSPVHALHEAWRHVDPETPFAIGVAGVLAWLAGINWAIVISVVGMGVLTFGSILIQLHKQWLIAGLKVDAARRKILDAPPIPPPGYVRDTRWSG